MFSIILGIGCGFNAELFYYGFSLSGGNWSNDNIFVIFFLGNSFSLLIGLLFERLYKRKRKYPSKKKLFFLWVYIISMTWFFGNVIVGAFFNFGIGSAMLALGIPFFIRLLFALLSIAFMLYLGYYSQKHVVISANAYFSKLSDYSIRNYFIHQIVIPIVLGILVIVLFKIPHLGDYHYLDLLILLSIGLFIIGLFIRFRYLRTIKFKCKSNSFKLSFFPFIILFIIILILRIGLSNGLAL